MKNRIQKRSLCKFLFSVVALVLTTVGSIAEQSSDDSQENNSVNRAVRGFYLLNKNDVPAFWGNPVISTFYDATGRHTHTIERSRALATVYAMASRAEATRAESTEAMPTLAYVVAPTQLDGLFLAQPLKQKLEEEWENTPLFDALQEPETRVQNSGVPDGTDCLVFVSGSQNTNWPVHYILNSGIIIADTSLSEDEIYLCFQNKTAVMFGAASSNFDYDRQADPDVLSGIYFSLVPTFLELGSVCRKFEFANTLGCVARSLDARYGHLLRLIDDSEER